MPGRGRSVETAAHVRCKAWAHRFGEGLGVAPAELFSHSMDIEQ